MRFKKGEPAILVELFLPYKAKYQGGLYDTLSKGLNLWDKKYASHFNSENEEKIKEMLAEYAVPGDYQNFITRNRRVFTGYSTYEMHGVFCSRNGGDPIEEQTTVIKIIFMPDYDILVKEVAREFPTAKVNEEFLSNLFRVALRNSYRDSEITPVIEYTALAGAYNALEPEQREFCVRLAKDWIEDVGLFLFGYIVFELTRTAEDTEEEIWVTSHWNFYVNRIVRENATVKEQGKG